MIQTQGAKRWKIWPGPDSVYRPHIFNMMGKSDDKVVEESNLGEPWMETTLTAGQVRLCPVSSNPNPNSNSNPNHSRAGQALSCTL